MSNIFTFMSQDTMPIHRDIILDFYPFDASCEYEPSPLIPDVEYSYRNENNELIVEHIVPNKTRCLTNQIIVWVTPSDLQRFTVRGYVPLFLFEPMAYDIFPKLKIDPNNFRCDFCFCNTHHITKCKYICRLPCCENFRIHKYHDWHVDTTNNIQTIIPTETVLPPETLLQLETDETKKLNVIPPMY